MAKVEELTPEEIAEAEGLFRDSVTSDARDGTILGGEESDEEDLAVINRSRNDSYSSAMRGQSFSTEMRGQSFSGGDF